MGFLWEEGSQRVKILCSSSFLSYLACPTADAASCGLVTFCLLLLTRHPQALHPHARLPQEHPLQGVLASPVWPVLHNSFLPGSQFWLTALPSPFLTRLVTRVPSSTTYSSV